jgi:hypothetical protein
MIFSSAGMSMRGGATARIDEAERGRIEAGITFIRRTARPIACGFADQQPLATSGIGHFSDHVPWHGQPGITSFQLVSSRST